jgi:hypothetical protein
MGCKGYRYRIENFIRDISNEIAVCEKINPAVINGSTN